MYPIHLIPIMVRGVPSAHVLIGFLGDLLVGANLERRIFGVILMAELIEQVPVLAAFLSFSSVCIYRIVVNFRSFYIDFKNMKKLPFILNAVCGLSVVSRRAMC